MCKSKLNITQIHREQQMKQQFQCTKIKDGLYIGNIVAAHDYEFLFCNKFGSVVNCTAEIPNVFEHENVRYLKFKLVEKKPHKLWDQTLKKLNKLEKFIQQTQQTSLCCLIHSFHGENRSLVFVTAYLMKKYQWRLKKCLQFLKSKQIFIGLSDHYIAQLQILEQILSKNSILSSTWTPPYINQEEQIISKTYLNSHQGKDNTNIKLKTGGNQTEQLSVKKKTQKRIVWLDRLQRKKQKQQLSQKKQQQKNKIKEKSSTHIQTVKHRIPQYDSRDPQLIKNVEFNSAKLLASSNEDKKKKGSIKKSKRTKQFEQASEQDVNKEKNIYQLTINNFISPNFNIISKTQPVNLKKSRKQDKQKQRKSQKQQKQKSSKTKDKDKKQRPTSASIKPSQKINRAQSQKQVTTSNKELRQIKLSKQKKSTLRNKQRDVKKQLKKEIQKVQKQKSSHCVNSLHLLYPLSNMANQLIKSQQGNHKRSSTPTIKQRMKQLIKF